MSRADLVSKIAQILEPWAWETKSWNATCARDDATAKAEQIADALTEAASQPREGEVDRHIASLRGLSAWLLSNDLDMNLPDAVDCDPDDTADLLARLTTASEDAFPAGKIISPGSSVHSRLLHE